MRKLLIGILFLSISPNGFCQLITNEIQKILASDGTSNDWLGYSVSVSGNKAVVGAPNDYSNGILGAAYVYEFDGYNWIEKIKLQPSDGTQFHSFGWSVAIDENTIIIGAPMDIEDGSATGSAYIYKYNGQTWVESAKLLPSNPTQDQFGYAVAIHGNKAIAGKWRMSAYIFEFNGTSWDEIIELTNSDFSGLFGQSVAIYNDMAVVGDIHDDDNGNNAGAAYIYKFDGVNWNETKILASDGSAEEFFGWDVDLDSNYIVIAAYNEGVAQGSDEGAVYLFEYNSSTWIETLKMMPSDRNGGQVFGYSVAISNDKILVSALGDDSQGQNTGSAYLFEFDGTNWNESTKYLSSDAAQEDRLGWCVDIDSNVILVSADFDDDNGSTSGSAYFFLPPTGIFGHVFTDINSNCINENGELGITNRLALITPDNIIIETNSSGRWHLDSLPVGIHTITYDTSGNWTPTCSPIQTFTVTDPDSLIITNKLGLASTFPCAESNISIYAPFLRRCFTDQKIYVQVCNEASATGVLLNDIVHVTLDPLLTITSSSLMSFPVSDNVYGFVLPGVLQPGNCIDFWINTTVSCDVIIGQTLCIEADLFPQLSCLFDTIPADVPGDFTPCALPWDQSSISIESWCDNDSIYFTVSNIGTGDMDCYSPMRLFIDGEYILLDSIQLLASETDTLVFSGDGRTWRLEVDQHPLHPGNSHPNSSIELCGNIANWRSNFINILPLDDADPIVDIYCGVVTASYDPNDKTGYPLGVTDSHYVAPNGKLDYVIRFQNTGTDTAFTVVVRDTIDMDLNIFSVVSGASSHDYSFRMYGTRILEWTFNNILLPDSTTDEPGSNGFVSFEVQQMPNLPDGTEINNEVGIYFDFNAPIITNTTSHIIHRDINLPSYSQQINISDTACHNYLYNGITYNSTGEYFQTTTDTLLTLNLLIHQMNIDAGTDTSICLGESIIINGSGAFIYSWDNSVIDGISFTPSITEIYHLIATDTNGCLASDSLLITVISIPQVNFIYSFNNFEITLEDSSSIDVNNWYWIIDGDSLSSQSTAQYLFTQNGSYEICLIASNDCFSDTTCQQIDITTIGIDDLNSSSGLKIYPNPTHSNFTIETSELNNSPFEITDITGKIIFTGILKDKLTNVDLSNVSDGIYLLKMESETIKIIKQ